jgi:hypothetical protein
MLIEIIIIIIIFAAGFITGVLTLGFFVYRILKKNNALYLWDKKKYPKEN